MKQVIDLSTEFIIDAKFKPNKVEGKIDWIDDKKKEANGKIRVDSVSFLVSSYSADGYSNGLFNKVFLNRDDILKLADKINEIETDECIGIPHDYLPF